MESNILITGYPYVRENYLNTFNNYPGQDKVFFLLPEKWLVKKGKVVFKPPRRDNIFVAKAYFHHSDYPLVGGLLKGWMPAFPYRLLKLRRDKNIGLVYDSGEPILLSSLYNAFWSKLFGLKYVVFSWENISFDKKFSGLNGLAHKWILKINLALADGVICGNKKGQEIFAKITKKPTAVIPLSGLDTELFHPGKENDLQVNENKVAFTFIGAISYRKGIHLIIEAFGRVLKVLPEAHLTIAGSGEYEQRIEKQLSLLETHGHVTRIPWLAQKAVLDLLRISDVFLYPSISHGGWEEQFGYSMAEASLCEVPVIATRSGSIEDVVDNGKTGILVEENNVEALTDAMIKLAQDRELRQKLGHAGREFIKGNFSNEIVAEKFHKFFQNLTK